MTLVAQNIAGAHRPSSHFLHESGPRSSINSVHTRCVVKTSGFTRGVCKNLGFFIEFKGFLVEFLESRAILRKSKTPRKSPEKWTFLSLAFYNAPSLHSFDSR